MGGGGWSLASLSLPTRLGPGSGAAPLPVPRSGSWRSGSGRLGPCRLESDFSWAGLPDSGRHHGGRRLYTKRVRTHRPSPGPHARPPGSPDLCEGTPLPQTGRGWTVRRAVGVHSRHPRPPHPSSGTTRPSVRTVDRQRCVYSSAGPWALSDRVSSPTGVGGFVSGKQGSGDHGPGGHVVSLRVRLSVRPPSRPCPSRSRTRALVCATVRTQSQSDSLWGPPVRDSSGIESHWT